jgi:DNA polymerase
MPELPDVETFRYIDSTSLNKKIKECKKCKLWKNRKKAVPGEGPTNPKVMFIGEAPGKNEDIQGKPFVGRAGKLLNSLLQISNLNRKEVFITSVIKCRPPNNRKPKTDELNTCIKLWMCKQIELINPDLVVILGGVALKSLLNKNRIKDYHSKIINMNNRNYFITYHPAAGLRFPILKQKLQNDFEKLKELI